MPEVKTSLYDAVVAVTGTDPLDLTGKACLVNDASGIPIGQTGIRYDGAVTENPVTAGMPLYNARGAYIGKVQSNVGNIITFEKGSKVALADDDFVCTYPKYEIVLIQCIGASTGNIAELIPCEDFYPGTKLADCITTWTSSAAGLQTLFKTADAGVVWNSTNHELPIGGSIEGRWKFMQPVSGDDFLCYLKCTPLRMSHQ